ncbi:MAG TPA: formylglycine-generating enzyme family protein, partial [Gammaproteobacteria bacterium]|nr:formylglycine-generating enzyme family protein [Gammaproteobacteria bacterium]
TVCLGCDIEMAVWDKICGECGGRQTELKQQVATKATEKAGVAEIIGSEPLTNHLGMTFVHIRSGTFLMGTSVKETGEFKETGEYGIGLKPDTDEAQHAVTITENFCMQTTVVTQRQWNKLMGTEPWQGWFFNKSYVQKGANYPASYVSWNDAVAFCEILSKQEGKTYRLPTEAEWEYACRAGTKTIWSFGNDENVLDDYAWHSGNSWDIGETHAHQVGLKKPNAFGLYDMHGNVYEWCYDYYDENYYKQSPEKDPTGPASGSCRVLRGGSWGTNSRLSRSAFRQGRGADYSYGYNGFRIVRELD